MQTLRSEEYIVCSPGRPAANASLRKRWIEAVDVTGDAAVGNVVLDYADVVITDDIALLKVGGEWKNVNKIFTWQPKR